MSNKKTHKKIKKIKVKKNNKSKRKYKKKGAGQTLSRRRQNTPPSPHTPPGSPPRTPSPPTPQLILNNDDDLPVAEASFTPIVPATRNVTSLDAPILNTYSNDRVWTVNLIMSDFEFNNIKGVLKKEIRLALLNYVRHGDNFILLHGLKPKKVDDSFEKMPHFKKKQYVRGELRILVEEWDQWRQHKHISYEEAVIDLIEKLKSSPETDIYYHHELE